MNPPDLWRIINRQDDGDIELIATLPPCPIDDLLSIKYPSHLLRLAADQIGIDSELARRLVARALSVMSYQAKRNRLKELLRESKNRHKHRESNKIE